MSVAESVEDATDVRLADYVDLREPSYRTDVERAGGFFIAESPRVIATVVRAKRPIRSVLVTPHQYDAMTDVLASVDARIYVAPPAVLRAVVGFDLHRGAVASVERWELPPLAAVLANASRVAVVERVNDHENLGVLFRAAAAFALDAVLLDPECADPLYRRCARVSIGHVCTVPWARYDDLAQIRAEGVSLVALTPARDAIAIEEVDWPARCAVMVGAEGPGLSAAALAAADLRVRIPMRDDVDSLNVATAAAIAFHRLASR